ncbi:hypothetical protein GpSGHVEth065 [Glossina pallidipes salivary gland hypertrophy virus]|uniref:Uncharacterized protein n=1 Tax=Glossina hytrovirus (isolate Glossina pallidipes/Ethiopia/Seibersdorf/-) TaxID=379529 RepID=A0A109QSE2_GHVS|nr:hypothetical protein GpSGHVEth065 [Glossina pallidipes salivary gland hypertrophy virus]
MHGMNIISQKIVICMYACIYGSCWLMTVTHGYNFYNLVLFPTVSTVNKKYDE